MLNALMLTAAVITMSAGGVIRKYYNERTGSRGVFFSTALSVVVAGLVFVFSSGFKFSFEWGVLWYALAFAAGFGASSLFGFLAIKTGPLSLTSLVTSYSLIIPTLYGLIFLGDETTIFFWTGLGLLLVSLFLINKREKNAQSDSVKITLPWVICVLVAFFANGIGSTVQTMQVKAFEGAYKNEMMIIALSVSSLIIFAISLFTERSDIPFCFKKGAWLMAISGLSTGALNLLVMLLNDGRMNASIVFPVISGGCIIITWLVAHFLYKEKLTKWQNAALVFGIVSVVLMNI